MAISAPQLRLYLGATKNVKRVNTVVKGLTLVENDIDTIYQNSTNELSQRRWDLTRTLTQLGIQKRKFLNLTQCDTLEELQERVNQAYQNVKVLQFFTGSPMYNKFIAEALQTAGISRGYQEQYFQQLIQEAWETKYGKEEPIAAGETLGEVVIEYLGKNENVKRHYSSTTRFKTLASYKDATLDQLTIAQREGFLKIYKHAEANNEIKTKTSNHTTWFTIVDQGKTSQKTANEIFTNDQDAKNAFIDQMLSFIQETLPIDDTSDLYQCIKEVLTAYPAGFFTGRTEHGITTTIEKCLGEIQGLYIARAVFPATGYSKDVAEWVGGIKNTNKVDPHEDILMKLSKKTQTLGFQIKNTSRNVMHPKWEGKDIEFASRNAETFFDLVGLTQKESEVLAEIYNMEAFNNEYVYDKTTKKFTHGSNPAFAQYREQIVTYAAIADKILSVFADVLLYMSTQRASWTLSSPGNILYLVGSKLYFAFDILNTIYQELDLDSNTPHFQIHAKYGSKTSRDIVDYWNEMADAAPGTKRATARQAIGSLKLTSSYFFK